MAILFLSQMVQLDRKAHKDLKGRKAHQLACQRLNTEYHPPHLRSLAIGRNRRLHRSQRAAGFELKPHILIIKRQ